MFKMVVPPHTSIKSGAKNFVIVDNSECILVGDGESVKVMTNFGHEAATCNPEKGDTKEDSVVPLLEPQDNDVNEAGRPIIGGKHAPAEADDSERGVKGGDDECNGERPTRCGLGCVLKSICKGLGLLALLYIFICSLDFLSTAFRLLGGKYCGTVFNQSELIQNPIAGLMIGILATVMLQSSSTSTSIVVMMVASGIIDVRPAIPIIMGANVGTSVTNTLVSMMQSGDRDMFEKAFAGATVHDVFNWLTVLVLLPLEVFTGYLYEFTCYLVKEACIGCTGFKGGKQDILKVITKPLTDCVVKLDKSVLQKIALGIPEYMDMSLMKKYKYDEIQVLANVTVERNVSNSDATLYSMMNVTEEVNITQKVIVGQYDTLFNRLDLSDSTSGAILLVVSLTCLCLCLVGIVKLLNTIMKSRISKLVQKMINADFPKPFHHLTGYVAIIVGAILTTIVQSSSIFTSTLTPLVGVGLISVERMYPLTLGANIGTTMTGVLAALAAPGDRLDVSIQIALCHLFFNISGIILFYPAPPLRKLPIKAAKFLGSVTAKYRWFAVVYLVLMFIVLPMIVFGLSFAGKIPCFVVFSLVALVVAFIVILNVMQKKCKNRLPTVLQSWDFLPLCLRSLEPVDRIIVKLIHVFKSCCPTCLYRKGSKSKHNSDIPQDGVAKVPLIDFVQISKHDGDQICDLTNVQVNSITTLQESDIV